MGADDFDHDAWVDLALSNPPEHGLFVVTQDSPTVITEEGTTRGDGRFEVAPSEVDAPIGRG